MTPTDTRAVLAALRASDHKYMGIRPADATPTEAPCIILGDASANALQYALSTASDQWPDCTDWELIGSDEALGLQGADWPPTMDALRMPATLATFAT